MKKVILILFLSLILILFSFNFLYTKNEYKKIENDNNNLIIEIERIKQDIERKNEINSNFEIDKATLEEENKEKIKEQNIWIELKEKLKQAIS